MDKNSNKKTELKIFHGPKNIGGLAGHLAKYQKELGYISESRVYNDSIYFQNSDENLNLKQHNLLYQCYLSISFFIKCLSKYNLFQFYFGKTFFHFGLDLPILKLFRKKTIMVYCGSEVRLLKSVEYKRNPYIYVLNHGYDNKNLDCLKKLMMWWHNIWIDKFFAGRSLYENASHVIPKHKIIKNLFINNLMDIESFHPLYKQNDIPILVHAPTSPKLKGSEYIENAISQLKEDGYAFEYIRLEKIPNDEARRIYREKADIIVDQLLLGEIGCLAIEGMYYGKPVCCYVTNDFMSDYPDCPIVNCNIDNIKEKLAWLIDNPQDRIQIGKQGRAYVEKYYDQKEINKKLLEIYDSLFTG